MSDTYEIIGMTIVGLVVLGITGAAVKFGFTNSMNETGYNSSNKIQGDESWENIYSSKSDASQATPDSDVEDEYEEEPVMQMEDIDDNKSVGGFRKRKLTKSKKSKKHRKSHKKTKKHRRHK